MNLSGFIIFSLSDIGTVRESGLRLVAHLAVALLSVAVVGLFLVRSAEQGIWKARVEYHVRQIITRHLPEAALSELRWHHDRKSNMLVIVAIVRLARPLTAELAAEVRRDIEKKVGLKTALTLQVLQIQEIIAPPVEPEGEPPAKPAGEQKNAAGPTPSPRFSPSPSPIGSIAPPAPSSGSSSAPASASPMPSLQETLPGRIPVRENVGP
jgi:hypothetical protein